MSDFISRLAARTLSPGATAQPRLRSRFEPASISDEVPDGAEHTSSRDPGTAPHDADGRRAEASGPEPSPLGHHPEATLDDLSRVPPSRTRPPARTDDRNGARSTAATASILSAPLGGELIESVPTPGQAAPAPVPFAARAAPTPAVVITQPSNAALADAAARSSQHGTQVAAAPAPTAAPNVQIHIGRLDVRANLQAPAAGRPPNGPTDSRDSRDNGLALEDYLDGKRSAR